MKIFEVTENISHTSKRLRDTERERDVNIGSDEWFKLWFSLPYLKEAKITELFDDIYSYQIGMQTRWFTVYEFGDDISVTIEKLEDGDDYYVLSFDKDGEEGATGEGDQFKVFGTVMAIAKDFIKQQAPNTFKFSAEKVDRNTGATGRPRLYSRLSKALARQSGYDVVEKSNGRYMDYILTRNQDVTESNPFTDARMNAIKAGKTEFTVGGKTYKVTGDTSDERAAVANEKLDEETGKEMLKIFRGMHHEAGMNKDMDRYIRSHDWKLGDFTPDMFPSEEEFFDYDDPFDRVIDIDYSHRVNLSAPIIVGPQYSDSKYSVIDGNHRAATAQRMGKTIQAYFPVEKTTENFAEAVSIPENVFHMKNRLLKVKQILSRYGNRPLMFRSFAHDAGPVEKIIKKVTNDSSLDVKTGINSKQNEVLKKLGIQHPTFATMAAGKYANVNRDSLEDHEVSGMTNIFIPLSNEIYYSDVIEDLGMGRKTGESNISLPKQFDVDEAVATYKKGWPGANFDNEIIVDTKEYYLLNLRSFLLELTSPEIKNQIKRLKAMYLKSYERRAEENHINDILKELFNAKITTYNDISRWIETVAVPFVDMLIANRGKPTKYDGPGNNDEVKLENFADGKNPGRKGLAKRSGVNTKASVSDLRNTAKNSSGEKQRMAHWLANMKAGRKKNSESILEDEDEIYYSKKFAPVAKKIFKSMYPDAKVNAKEDGDGYLAVETTDGGFGFSMGVSHQYGDNVITVANAYAGQYKGVVGQMVKSAVEFLQQKHPDAETTLVAQHDVSDNYWPQLANKLGINYENNEW